MTGGRQLQEYEEQDESFSFDTQDIGALVKRRKWHVILPAVLLFPLVVAVAFLLPSIYRSEAMILVERPNVPPELVSTTVTTTLMERVQTIQRRFLATENLKDFVLKHELYQEGKSDQSLSSFIEGLRQSITVDLVPTERQGPNVAFSISSEDRDPYVAHIVTKELVDWYMKENAQARQRQAESASQFLAKEAATLKEEIGRLEKELADLRVKYDGSLPGQRDQNLQQLSRLQEQIANLDFEAETLRERKRSLQDELALVPAYGPYVVGEERVLGPEEQLKALELQLMELSGQYTSAHPDIIGLRQKIETLKGRVASRTGGGSAAPDNPRYLRLQEQIQAIDRDLDIVARRRGVIEAQIGEIDQRLAKTEEIEQQHNALVRDYRSATEDYAAIRRKELTADLGQSLEAEQMSERFSLIEPPDVPKQPASPNRLIILFAGGLLSVGAGFATGIMAELLDPAIHGSKRLAKITGAAPLVVVPYIRTRAEIQRVWLRYGLIVLLLLALIGAGLAFVHLQVTPLDVFWLKISG
jgi:polysaccharide chain length determinant protein (PEP-CTERM system associated)